MIKAVLATVLVLVFIFANSFAQGGKPNMVIENPVHDAGVVVRTSAPIEHAFQIKNAGTAELKIFDVKPG